VSRRRPELLTWERARAKENNFRRKLDEFAAEDCADLERLKLIECSGTRASECATPRRPVPWLKLHARDTAGVDKQGRPVVWITGRHLPAVGMDLERIKWFIYTKLQRVAERGKFVIVYMHTDATWEVCPTCPATRLEAP
jgi:hypothetical protein